MNSFKKMGEENAFTIKTKVEQDKEGNLTVPPMILPREKAADKVPSKADARKALLTWLRKKGAPFTAVLLDNDPVVVWAEANELLETMQRELLAKEADAGNSEQVKEEIEDGKLEANAA